MVKITTIFCALVVLGGLPAQADLTPFIDGRFDTSEGYTTGYYVNFEVEGGKNQPLIPVSDQGQLWRYQDASGNLYVALIQPVTLVDNSYGANSIGWGSAATSGKNHKFRDLKCSDKARFSISDGAENVMFDFTLDYITASEQAPSGFASLGATGGDGKVHSGLADSLLAWGTSLDYNFNTLGYVLTEDSPATDEDYTENPNFPGWLFEVTYEFQVDGSLFAENGFGGLTIPIVHDSPNKLGKNKVWQDGDLEPFPVPGAVILGVIGIGFSSWLGRRKFSV